MSYFIKEKNKRTIKKIFYKNQPNNKYLTKLENNHGIYIIPHVERGI